MPNTLAHIGAQFPIGKGICRKWDPRWIALGLLLPDLPWILQRIALVIFPFLSPITIRSYVVVVSTPLFCIILAASIACLFEKGRSIFQILVFQSLLHLALDACQQKGGVGVPFFAPFYWQAFSFPIYSMNGWVTNILNMSGVLILLLVGSGKIRYPKLNSLALKRPGHLSLAVSLMLLYGIAPLLLRDQVIEANVHDLKVWQGEMPRSGAVVHFDRAHYFPGQPGGIQDDFNPTPIPILGIDYAVETDISTTAVFVDENTLQAGIWVIHPPGIRLAYTLIGLIGIGLIWMYPLIQPAPKGRYPIRDRK
jgi:hypothetical protein